MQKDFENFNTIIQKHQSDTKEKQDIILYKESELELKLKDNKNHKFVLIKHLIDKTLMKYYLIALPINEYPMHRDIVKYANNKYNLYVPTFRISGGYIKKDENKIVISGSSGDYGEADKDIVEKIIKTNYPDQKVEIIEEYYENYKKPKKEKEKFDTDIQYKMYQEILKQSFKLGKDYISIKPTLIDNNPSLAYMVYSSENGSSFGFNTLYLAFKNKNGNIKYKAIVQNKDYLHIKKVTSKNNIVNITYKSNGNTKNIEIDIKNLDTYITENNFDEVDKEILNMYAQMQSILPYIDPLYKNK